MSLHHDFVLLPDDGDRRAQYSRHVHDPSAIHLHDDLIGYFWDTLRWIPSENPADRDAGPGFGLNRFGPTALCGNGAAVAAAVFRAWAALLSNGPASLELSGGWEWADREARTGGQERRLHLQRDEVVAACLAIANLAERAREDGHWLCHFGL